MDYCNSVGICRHLASQFVGIIPHNQEAFSFKNQILNFSFIFVVKRFEGDTVGSVAAFYMLPPGPRPESRQDLTFIFVVNLCLLRRFNLRSCISGQTDCESVVATWPEKVTSQSRVAS